MCCCNTTMENGRERERPAPPTPMCCVCAFFGGRKFAIFLCAIENFHIFLWHLPLLWDSFFFSSAANRLLRFGIVFFIISLSRWSGSNAFGEIPNFYMDNSGSDKRFYMSFDSVPRLRSLSQEIIFSFSIQSFLRRHSQQRIIAMDENAAY